MVRRTSLWLPVLIAGALGALFCACSGSDQTGLFSPSGGATGNAGANANAGGPSAAGGRAATGGSSSAAGSTNVAGSSASGGNSNSGGATGVGGMQNGGGSANAGGAATGGAGNSGGSANGGSAGASTAGSNNGGASGTGGASGGNGGAAGTPTCQDLIATAAQQLDAARVCNNSGNAEQCTGSVSETCGCQVPVESDDSPETKAYLATLALIQAKHCIQVCPAIACVFGQAQCKSQGGSSSACVAGPLTPVH